MPASLIARATASPVMSPPRTERSVPSQPRRAALRNALKAPPPASSRMVPGFDALAM